MIFDMLVKIKRSFKAKLLTIVESLFALVVDALARRAVEYSLSRLPKPAADSK